MNKNKTYELIFFISNAILLISIVINLIVKFLDFTTLLAVFFFVNGLVLFIKFIFYSSDSSLYLSIFFLFSGIFLLLYSVYELSNIKLLTLLYLSNIIASFFVYINFKSKIFLYLFLSGFLLFFPIFFYTFNIIVLNIFFIFLVLCVIINLIMYFIFFKV